MSRFHGFSKSAVAGFTEPGDYVLQNTESRARSAGVTPLMRAACQRGGRIVKASGVSPRARLGWRHNPDEEGGAFPRCAALFDGCILRVM